MTRPDEQTRTSRLPPLRYALQAALLVVPLAYLAGGRWWAVGLAGAGALLSSGFDYLRLRRVPAWNRIARRYLSPLLRRGAVEQPLRTTYQLAAALLVLLAAPAGAAIPALLWQSVGDPVAGIVGRDWGRTRLLGRKTLEGSAACFLASLAVAAPLLRIGELGFGPLELLVGAAVAALAELACREAEDDFLMPVVAAAVLTALLWAKAASGS